MTPVLVTVRSGALLVAVGCCAVACRRPSEASPGPGSAAPAKAVVPVASSGASSDVVELSDKTDTHGAIFEVGKPRMQLSRDDLGGLAVRAGSKLVFARDRDAIKIWDLETGKLLHRIVPSPARPGYGESFPFTVARDSTWLALGYADKLTLRKPPFEQVEFTVNLAVPMQFTPDAKWLAVDLSVPAILDLSQHKIVATAPDLDKRHFATLATRISEDGQVVHWVRDDQVARWDRRSNKIDLLYKPPAKLTHAAIAQGSMIAAISDGKTLSRVDLTTGAVTPLAPLGTFLFALSATGKRVAVVDHRVIRVLDVASGKTVWSIQPAGGPGRIAFSEQDDVIAYLEDKTLRVVDLSKGLRPYETPSRFAGWLSEGVIAIQQAGAFTQLALATHAAATSSPGALAALAPTRPPGAPAWATWIAAGPGGTGLAAEPSDRHAAPWEHRAWTACEPKLRVFTPQGGVKSLALARAGKDTASGHDDPCWDIGGGWVVGVSTNLATLFEATTGKQVATLDVGHPRIDKPAFAHRYYAMALSPSGGHLALLWRRADVWGTGQAEYVDPREDAMHRAEHAELPCDTDDLGQCEQEYFGEVWSLQGKPKRVWQARFDASVPTTRTWPLAKRASGPIAFTHDGQRVLFGFDDGDVELRSVAAPGPPRVEHLHHAPIARLEVSPGDGWVFSEDTAGEQRVWQLPPP